MQKCDVTIPGMHVSLRIVGGHHTWHHRQYSMHLDHIPQENDAVTEAQLW